MVWSILESTVNKALHYSTPLGYMWMFLLFTFRMFITAVVGSAVYGDEVGAFRCDTNQPGCQNVCYNRFSPISHMRFWAFQMMFVCLPSLAFMTFAQFEIAKIELVKKERADEEKKTRAADYFSSAQYKAYQTRISSKEKKLGMDKMKQKLTITSNSDVVEVKWTPRIRTVYIIHLLFKLFLEIVFLYFSYVLQQQQSKKVGLAAMWVPEKYECTHGETELNSACSQNPLIPCWVSRPWEKTIFMLYMTTVTCFSILICVLEFIYVLTRTTKKSVGRRAERNLSKKNMIRPTRGSVDTSMMDTESQMSQPLVNGTKPTAPADE